jgi:dolichol-phosphate mannosyltransferase
MSRVIAETYSSSPSSPVASSSTRHRRAVIVLPAFNEEESLPPLFHAIRSELAGTGIDYRVIVVDDGSTDGTARVIRDAAKTIPAILVSHSGNRGLAAAIRTGLRQAASEAEPDDVIITMDADNTHPPGLIPRMIGMIGEGHDVVIASRFQPGSRVLGVPWHRNLLSYGARALFTIALPIRGVRDYTCGYRVYRAGAIQRALTDYGDDFVSERGFSCMVDVLLKLRYQRLIMGEVPMVLRYDQKGGASKMQVARTAIQTLSLIVRRKFYGASMK